MENGFGNSQPHVTLHRVAGFTLVELLVTLSLMALVGGACVATLGTGLRVWRRAEDYGTRDQAVLVAFERMRRDLENIRRFAPLPFEGKYNQSIFPTVDRVALKDADGPPEVGRLGYFLDTNRHLLCRSFVPYRSMKRTRMTDRCQVVLEGVTTLRFAYFGTREGSDDWSERWASNDPPTAVKVSVTLADDRQQTPPYTFIVSIMSAPFHDEKSDKPS